MKPKFASLYRFILERYKLWRDTMDRRDKEMLNNIYQYCKDHSFGNGVFLVGAAHRQSITEKAKEQLSAGSEKIQWEF